MAGDSSSHKDELRRKARAVYRGAILESAEQVFASRGMQGARMADIAAGAGVATGTLYNYFDGKQAIFHSLTELRLTEYNDKLAAVCDAAETPGDALRGLLRVSFEFLDKHRAMYLVVVEIGGGSMMGLRAVGGPAAARLQDEYLRMYGEVVRALVAAGEARADVAPELQLAFLTGTMTGLIQDWALSGDERPLTDRAELACDLFLHGVRATT